MFGVIFKFLNENNNFIKQGGIELLKCDSKDFYTKICFKLILLFWALYLSNIFFKNYIKKKSSSTTVFSIDTNKKCFLSTKSVY